MEEEPWFFELLGEAEKEASAKGDSQAAIEGAINVRTMRDYVVSCSYNDLVLIICMLHDYVRALDKIKSEDLQYRSYYRKVFSDMEARLSKQIGYDYDKAAEKCRKKREKRGADNDVGENGLLLLMKKGRTGKNFNSEEGRETE